MEKKEFELKVETLQKKIFQLDRDAKLDFTDTIEDEISDLIKIANEEKLFWQLSSFRVYEELIPERIKTFLSHFPDAEEIDFWTSEKKLLEKYEIQNSKLKNEPMWSFDCRFNSVNLSLAIPYNLYQSIWYSLSKRENFVELKIAELKQKNYIDESFNTKNEEVITPLIFEGDNVEIYEVIKGLYEMDKFPQNTEIEVFAAFNKILSIDINAKNGRDTIRKRKGLGGITYFIDQMRDALHFWDKNLDKKKKS
ncbi:MAG: hypothetical protein RLN79_05015 [Cytophagales bacterium]